MNNNQEELNREKLCVRRVEREYRVNQIILIILSKRLYPYLNIVWQFLPRLKHSSCRDARTKAKIKIFKIASGTP